MRMFYSYPSFIYYFQYYDRFTSNNETEINEELNAI